MRIAVIGGGPGGLLFATLAARSIQGATVELFERNAAGDSFGFGVVFSDSTERGIDEADSVLRDTLDRHGVRWDEIEVRVKGERFRFAGNGMGAVLRKDLLAALQHAAQTARAALHFNTEVDLAGLHGYDLVVAADGANSRSRAAVGDDALGLSTEVADAKFIWFATSHGFDGLTFLHAEVPGLTGVPGVLAAHAYPIGKGLSTFIVETDAATWRAAGLDGFDPGTPAGPSDEESKHRLEQLFAPMIDGAPLIGNNSRWASFRTIRASTWHLGNVVFLGDAVHTAHFSVGSGTKMALEDAIALADALQAHGSDLPAVFAAYENVRQPLVARIQDAAGPSLSWWEHFGEYHHALEPWQFAFHFFSRSLTAGRIAKRDASALEASRRVWETRHGASPLRTPITLASIAGEEFGFDRRVLAVAELPELPMLAVPDDAAALDASVSTLFEGLPSARAVAVHGGNRLTRQLAAEAVRFRHGAAAVILEPDCDDDRAETLVLSGRADAVAR